MNIDKNIPMPDMGRPGRPSVYGFGEMQIGDSMFFPDEPARSMAGPVNAARGFFARRGWKLCARGEGSGVRIWRTA